MSTEDRGNWPASLAYGAIGVSDIDRSLWFYCDVLGFNLVESSPLGGGGGGRGPRAYHLRCPGGGINLLTTGSRSAASGWLWDDLQIGVRHVGMKVAGVDDWAQRLHSLGTPFRLEPVEAVGNVRIAFFEDPDGANLEIVQGYIEYSKVWDSALVAGELGTAVPAPTAVRFDHVGVSTTNLDATLSFYERVFGFRVIGQLFYPDHPKGMTITMLRAGGAKLEVFTFTQPMTGCPWAPGVDCAGLRHVGIETGDVGGAARRATAAGGAMAAGPDGPGEPGGPGHPRVMLTDPDGIPLEMGAPS
jgi:catechol 2,3-dioxygenase-like lactoylglutathione lyase family enzyme